MAAVQELLDCMISSWYPRFQRETFKTILIPLPQPVVDWLVSDGLHMPAESEAFAKRGPIDQYATEDDYRDNWSSGEEDDGSAASHATPPPPELAAVREAVAAGIAQLGGRVVPKLSWSCPKDAVWLSPSASLACANADEVLLLLRASDRVAHDATAALPEAAAAAGVPAPAAQHVLALRRWHDLHPGREFRCFVSAGRLAGASQRDLTQRYDFLAAERSGLQQRLLSFHAAHIDGRFPHQNYAYDVYVATSGAVKLLDFNPAGGTTAPLLFTWQELAGGGQQQQAAAAQPAEPPAAAEARRQAGAGSQGEAAAGPPAQAAGPGCGCGAGEEQGGAPEPYLEQLRRVQALRLAEPPQQQQQQQQQQQEDAGAGVQGHLAEPEAPAAGAGPAFELRIVEEAVALRPAAAAYGVPFDFVDSAEGSALDRLMAQLQGPGGAEAWEALAAEAEGAGRQAVN